MLIVSFAQLYHLLHLRKDSCGDPIIVGRPPKPARAEDSNHIFDNSDGRLGVSIFCRSKAAWTGMKKRLLDAGLELHQNGDIEGTLLFHAENEVQAAAAIKAVGARRRKQLTPEHRAKLAANARLQFPKKEENKNAPEII